MSTADLTRRELISSGLLAGGVALAGSLQPAGDVAARTEAAASGREGAAGASALRALLEVERLAELAYRQVLRSGVLRPPARRTARALLAHEQAHVGVLGAWMAAVGATPVPASIDAPGAGKALAAHHVSGSLTRLGSEHEALALLIAVEAASERAYSRALTRLEDPLRLRVSLEMMACDAQHAAVLSGLLYPGAVSRAVPGALVPATR